MAMNSKMTRTPDVCAAEIHARRGEELQKAKSTREMRADAPEQAASPHRFMSPLRGLFHFAEIES